MSATSRRVVRSAAGGSSTLACAVLMVFVLNGCTSLPPRGEQPVVPWAERRAALQGLESFGLRGRVAVSAGGEGFNASLHWEQRSDAAHLRLDGPLGFGGLEIESHDGALTLRDTRGVSLDGAAARAELERRLGFVLPLESLRFWVLGVPDPAQPAEEVLNDARQLSRLEQDGWAVDFDRYGHIGAQSRPVRLTVRREGARMRLVIDRWIS